MQSNPEMLDAAYFTLRLNKFDLFQSQLVMKHFV